MKRIFLIIVCLCSLACVDKKTKNTEPSVASDTGTTETITDSIVPEENQDETVSKVSQYDTVSKANQKELNEGVGQSFSLEDFPKKWLLLSQMEDGDYAIYKYCDAQIEQIWLEHNEQRGLVITVLYGQDADEFKLVHFEATREYYEQYDVVVGHFVVEIIMNPDMDPEVYDFMWNQELKFATFDGFYQDQVTMVNENEADNYERLFEECDWD